MPSPRPAKPRRLRSCMAICPCCSTHRGLLRRSGSWVDPGAPRMTAIGHFQTLFSIVRPRSEEHTSELQSLMRISYAVFCLKKKKQYTLKTHQQKHTYNNYKT